MSTPASKYRQLAANGKPWALRATTLICLVLLTVLTFVQVAHVHPAATSADADHCPLCVVMHSAAPVSPVAATIILITGSAPIPVPQIHSVVRPWHCTLFNRPPPSIS